MLKDNKASTPKHSHTNEQIAEKRLLILLSFLDEFEGRLDCLLDASITENAKNALQERFG